MVCWHTPSSSESSLNLLTTFFSCGTVDFSVNLICCLTSATWNERQLKQLVMRDCWNRLEGSVTLGRSDVLPLMDERGGKDGGVAPPRSSFLSAKSLRPRLDRRDRPLSLEWGDDSHSLELDEPEEERVRPCDLFAGGAIELLLGAAERCFDEGDLEREREEEVDQPLETINYNQNRSRLLARPD